MTATDILRRLLDERGVSWWEEDGHTLWYGESIHHAASAFSSFMFGENERVHLNAMVTPEQAIEATLGRGTCRDVGRYAFVCSECGWASDEPRHVLGGFWPSYCPKCGKRVVEP